MGDVDELCLDVEVRGLFQAATSLWMLTTQMSAPASIAQVDSCGGTAGMRPRPRPRSAVCHGSGYLRRGGRTRRIPALAIDIISALRVPQPRQAPLVEQAMRKHALALLGVLNAVCDAVDQLAAALAATFRAHPDYEVITSFPGLADTSGAIMLAEIGDDRSRFLDDRAAGLRRLRAGDPRLGQVPHRRAAAHEEQPARRDRPLLGVHRRRPPPPPARDHYLRRRERGDKHPAALRHLFNRMLGQLHHCLHTGQTYDPIKAFPNRATDEPEPAAA